MTRLIRSRIDAEASLTVNTHTNRDFLSKFSFNKKKIIKKKMRKNQKDQPVGYLLAGRSRFNGATADASRENEIRLKLENKLKVGLSLVCYRGTRVRLHLLHTLPMHIYRHAGRQFDRDRQDSAGIAR